MTDLVLVTGATGFLGSTITRLLLDSGYRLRVLHRPTSRLDLLEGLDLERAVGDILQPDTLHPALEGVQFLFHAAAQSDYWQNPQGVTRTAVEGTRNVIQAARKAGVRRAVLTSSAAALGVPESGERIDEEHAFNLPPERFPYGYAKHLSEQVAREAAGEGLELVILNPSIVLGPGDINRISGSMVIEAARGLGFFWVEGGFNAVHVQDVAQGHLAALTRGQPGQRYLLGGENLTYYQAFSTLNRITGHPPPWLKIPRWVIEPGARLVEGLRPLLPIPFDANQLRISRYYLHYDLTKSQRELQLPDPIPFEQAVRETYRWYVEQGVL